MHTGLANLGLSASPNGLSPVLDLQFLSDAGVDGRITYSGGAGGTRVNSAGVIEAKTCPRIDFDPVTHAPKGMLVEEQRTNLLTWSSDFTNAAWTPTAVTSSTGVSAAPDGTLTASKLAEDNTSNLHREVQSKTVTAAQTWTFSAFLKAVERSKCFLSISDGLTGDCSVLADLGAGTVSATTSAVGLWTNLTRSIQAFPGGWYRVTVTGTMGGTSGSAQSAVYCSDGNSTSITTAYVGTTGSGLLVWGAQLEAGSFATSYIPTAAAAVTRTQDVAQINGVNFSSWFNTAQGTFVAEFDVLATTAASGMVVMSADSGAAHGDLLYKGAGAATVSAYNGPNSGLLTGVLTVATPAKAAVSYSGLGGTGVLNGGVVAVIAAGVTPQPTQMRLGTDFDGSSVFSGHIKRIRYWTSQLANTQLQALTT